MNDPMDNQCCHLRSTSEFNAGWYDGLFAGVRACLDCDLKHWACVQAFDPLTLCRVVASSVIDNVRALKIASLDEMSDEAIRDILAPAIPSMITSGRWLESPQRVARGVFAFDRLLVAYRDISESILISPMAVIAHVESSGSHFTSCSREPSG